MFRPSRWLLACAFALVWLPAAQTVGRGAQAGVPARLSDAEFRSLIQDFSEPDGFFRSDNLVSNEDTFQTIIPDLQRVVKPGGVYVGVGPDQNFTYIAALKPAVVFIPDVRRGNLHMHLMYKALMEQSADRAEFLSRLFSRKRPEGLSAASSPAALFNAFAQVPASREIFDRTAAAIRAALGSHGLVLGDADARGIEFILDSFYSAGPFLTYSSAQPFGRSRYPSFAELQIATDLSGVERAYLATEDNYRSVRALQQKNLIVPMVANFAGPKTLRAIGAWVREHGARVTTFYASNVEQYLFQDGIWSDFAGNLAALPTDDTSSFIRSCFTPCASGSGPRALMLVDSLPGMLKDYRTGLIRDYYDVLARRR